MYSYPTKTETLTFYLVNIYSYLKKDLTLSCFGLETYQAISYFKVLEIIFSPVTRKISLLLMQTNKAQIRLHII